MNIRRGDILKVDLNPTKGSEIKKERPAVVIQNDMGNKHSPLTIVAPMTEGKNEEYPVDVYVGDANGDLDKDSVVKLDQIRTVSVSKRVIKKYGSLSASRMRKVDKATKISLGLI
jgi:mRNA interferase MazF